MSTNKKKDVDELKEDSQSTDELKNEDSKELSLEDKLKESEDKLLRSLAEIENQRRRFEKEIKDAFEFGSFNFAKDSQFFSTLSRHFPNSVVGFKFEFS